MAYKILAVSASIISIAFGIWHFFVPKIYNWYSYIDVNAKELVLAIRAVNVFFSLSLVLIGIMNIILVLNKHTSKTTLIVVLSVSAVLWLTRVILQISYPQGTINAYLQYGMLTAFLLVLALYIVSIVLV